MSRTVTCAGCDGKKGWRRDGRWIQCDWCDGKGEIELGEAPAGEVPETDRSVGCALLVLALGLWTAVPWVAISRLGA